MTKTFIPISNLLLTGKEEEYVLDCLKTGWIGSGKYIATFEEKLATYLGVKHVILCSNGTAALHLSLMVLGIGPGDEVIVPSLTFVATANAVSYVGATPIFVDCDPQTWCMSVDALRESISPKTRAIIPVHLYGHPAPMDEIRDLAEQYNLYVVEDAAEALGATYNECMVGGLGDIGTFSFYANKIITMGEGGAVVTNNDEFAGKTRLLRNNAQSGNHRYWFTELGYNYRITNIQAAIGVAQLELVDKYIQSRREIAGWYKEMVKARIPDLQMQFLSECVSSSYWMNAFILPSDHAFDRDTIMHQLHQRGIETRHFFYPLHLLPMYIKCNNSNCPTSEYLSKHGICLPTYSSLSYQEVEYIIDNLAEIYNECRQNY